MAKYLVTGGAGFIGSNLARYILKRGHDVVVLDNFATGKPENLKDIARDIKLIEGDIRDEKICAKAVAGCRAVFHEAALGSVQKSVEEPLISHNVNVNGTINMLQAARAAGIKRFIFAASSSAYGDKKKLPTSEQLAVDPISPYAASKVACEAYMRAYAVVFRMETLCLRYFNVFGPYQDPQSAYAAVIPAFVSRLLEGKRPIVYGDGLQTRDFCYIENVCNANWLAAMAPSHVCQGQVLNIACHVQTSLNQIIAKLQSLLGTAVKPIYKPARKGDVRHSLADISLAKATIGYHPTVFFEKGLEKAIDWYRENLG